MKRIVIYLSVPFFFFACKKQTSKEEAPPPWKNDMIVANVKAYLKTNLSAADYALTDTSAFYISDESKYLLFRIAIRNKSIEQDFVLVQTDSSGKCLAGKFVHIRRDSSDMQSFNGRILTESLQHTEAVFKKITENAVQELSCADEGPAEESLEGDGCDIVPSDDCTGCLPLVVVVGYAGGGASASSAGISYSDYLDLEALAGATSAPAPSAGVYSPVSTKSPVASARTAGAITTGLPNLNINFESSYSHPGIDVNAFMKCFASIPDAGATCSIAVYTDLPVNDNPQYIFNILTGATGHAFLSMTKTNGTQSATQYIGKTTSKAIAVLGFPVAGKIVDNAQHKYNASLTMNITPEQLLAAINKVVSIGSTPSYDMWEDNCVDYALSILNTVRPSDPLYVGMSIDPSTGDEYQTPQSLYIALQLLKNQNGADAPHITMDVVSYAASSHGACN
ncbi:MAG: hypothetical protein JST87_04735 [Bacteroidetes bacterium]|nr:hypothetical protein [Bacteroidota bacterium]